MRPRTPIVAFAAIALCHCTSPARIGGDLVDGSLDADAGALGDAAAADGSLAVSSDAGVDAATRPSDASGDYTLVLKAGQNGCGFSVWTAGSVTTAEVTIMQNGASVTATVQGLAATTFGLTLGTTMLEGTVAGDRLALHGTGVTRAMTGTCNFTIDADITAVVRNDALEDGTVTYRRNLSATGCAPAATYACTSEEVFDGLRATTDQ